jgi:hypothetical protein
MSFPQGYFFIRNVASGKTLDVIGGSKEPGESIVIWDRKNINYDNQLWKYEDGFIVNKNSGLVLEIPGYESGGNIKTGTGLIQAERRSQPDNLNQLWAYNYQYIMPYDPKVCLWGKDGDVNTPGNKIIVDNRIHGEVTQEWMFDIP